MHEDPVLRELGGLLRARFPFVDIRHVRAFANRHQDYEGHALVKRVIDDPGKFVECHNAEVGRRHRGRVRELVKLDSDQTDAMVKMAPVNLVLAGAGSGKTHVLASRVACLVNLWGVKPEEVLVTCFARSAADEMRNRLVSMLGMKVGARVEVRTFHALGRALLEQSTGVVPEIHPGTVDDDGVFERTIERLLREALVRDQGGEMASSLGTWFHSGRSVMPLMGQFRSRVGWSSGMAEFLESLDETWELESPPASIEEMYLIEALGALGVAPEVIEEAPVGHPWAGRVLGVGDTRWCVMPSRDVAWVDSELAKGILADRGDLVVLDSNACRSRAETLETVRRHIGVVDDYDPEAVIEAWMRSRGQGWTRLVKTLVSVVRLWKTMGDSTAERFDDVSQTDARTAAFRVIVEGVLVGYEAMLEESGQYDFGDYLVHAGNAVREDPGLACWSHVLVDEAQDLMPGGIYLLEGLAAKARLFLVGDDWQSIYGWNGAQRGYLQTLVARDDVEVVSLSRSYRCRAEIMEVARSFVLRNPDQIEREVRGTGDGLGDKPGITVMIPWEGERLDSNQLREYLEYALLGALDSDCGSAMILSRYRHIPELYGIQEQKFCKDFGRRGLDVSFHTLHGAKGLEADYVVLLEVGAAGGGFPAKERDDRVLRLLAEDPEDFPHAEERRLFHVGLTRARESVMVLCAIPKVSEFVVEILKDPSVAVRGWQPEGVPISPRARAGATGSGRCPQCGSGSMLQLRGLGLRICDGCWYRGGSL